MNSNLHLTCQAFNLKTLTIVLLLALFCAQAAAQQGQTAARPDRGVNPGGAYAVSDVENISLQNGNVNLSIPLASLPPIAGGELSLTVRANYNSKLWNVVREEQVAGVFGQAYAVDQPQLSDAGGWSIGAGYSIIKRDGHADFDYQIPLSGNSPENQRLLQYSWHKYVLRTLDGAEHELRPTGSGFQVYGGIDYPRSYLWGFHTAVPTTATGPIRYDTIDGTYISVIYNPPNHASGINWTIFLADGTQVIDYNNGIQRIRDTNGNTISIFSDGTGTHYRDDQTNREIRMEFDPAVGAYGQTRVWYQTVGGVWQHVDINHGATTVRGKVYKVNDWNETASGEMGQQGAVCSHHQQLAPQTVSVVREIVFPVTEPNAPGRRFFFAYNSDTTETATTQQFYYACGQMPENYTRLASRGMGALSHMETPTGAQVDYTYTLASTHDFTGLVGADRLTRETVATKALTYKNLAGQDVTDTWTYDIPYDGIGSSSTVHNPDGSTSTISYYQRHPDNPRGVGTGDLLAGQVYYTSDGNTVTHKRWAMRGTTWATGTDSFTANNPYVEAEYTTLLDNNAPAKMSAKTYECDYNGNVTKVTEYDWFDPAAVQQDSAGVPTGVPAGARVLRVTNTSYYNPAPDANSTNYYQLRPLTTGVPSLLGVVKETAVGAARTRYSYDGQAYGVAPTAGNPTQVSRLDDRGDADSINDTWVTTSTTYGAYGNPSSTTDANGNVTNFFYDDETHALPTRVVVNPLNGTGSQTTATIYDTSTGLLTSVTDPNNQVSTIDYTNWLLGTVDPLGRPGMSRAPSGTTEDGVTLYRKVYTYYEDAARRTRTTSDLNTEGDGLLKNRTTRDQLERQLLVERNEGGSSYTISTQTVYAQAGRVTLTSSPARNGSPESWTRVTKDVYGRVVEVATFGGSAQPSAIDPANQIANWTGSVTTLYKANEATVTDQTGRKRRSVSDALGRLVRVDEPNKSSGALDDASSNPVQPTFYEYDSLGKLRRVDQGGQQRFFLYDSLSRLLRTKTPEQGNLPVDADFPALTDSAFGNPDGQWSMGYRYDAVGNRLKRKDARGVTTTYGYDGLNRNTTITYSGETGTPTPNVTRSYDGAPQGKGRLWKSESAQTGLTTVEKYDAAGHPIRQSQKFWVAGAWGPAYNVDYTYSLAGNVKTEVYPSGHSVAYAYDNAGRLSGLTGNLGGGGTARTYADSLAYDASGRVRQERYGTDTPVYNKHLFNSRGQLAEIRLSTYSLFTSGQEVNWNRGAFINHYSDSGWGATGGGSDNNGNLKRQDIFIPKIDGAGYDQAGNYDLFTQSFDYDTLNRLTRAAESWGGQTRWTQAYDYDRWGNRTVNADGTWLGPLPAPPASPPPPSEQVNEAQFDKAELQNTNRLYAPGDAARPEGQRLMRYDAAGNLAFDNYTGSGSRAYDAENRMTAAGFFAGQAQTAAYVYDADGRRVKRMVGTSAEMWHVYGASGELLAEYAPNASPNAPQKEYGYRGGELLVTASPGTASTSPRVNVAAAAAGATASASTAYTSLGATPDKTINGSRTNAGSYWNDQSENTFPDWLQVDFAGSQSINEVDLYFLQDNLGTAEPTEAMTFTQYGLTSFEVQYWTGSAWAAVPGGTVTGNNKVWRKLSFSALTTSKIRVLANAASDVWSRIVEVEAYEVPPNVAAAANGATATASSSYSSLGVTPDKAINGSRINTGSYWNDQTEGSLPDWLQVNFASPKNINEVDLYFLQDNSGTAEPTEAMTFTQYGVTAFEVQYWTGASWATVPGGSINGNNKVWRKVTFAPVTTDRIRIVVNGTTDVWSRIVEVEAYEGTGAPADVRWLVTDQIGTPRIALDMTGSLAGVARHDCLPFGEELGAGIGGRTTAQGYSQSDGVRNRYTGKERDNETGLDYFINRYYLATQGRFMSVDSVKLTPARMIDPQQLNLYAYARNNPLKFIDPDGKDIYLVNDTKEGRHKALLSITANMTAREAGNVGVRWNKDAGKYEAYIKDPSKIDPNKASQGYKDFADRVGNHDLKLNYTLLEKGKSTTVELLGVPTTVTQKALSGANGSDAGGFVSPQSDGSFAVVVAEGGYIPGVNGLSQSGREITIASPDYTLTAHELFAETYKYTPAGIREGLQNNIIDDSKKVIEIENRYRDFHGLPRRTGTDHGYIQETITVRP